MNEDFYLVFPFPEDWADMVEEYDEAFKSSDRYEVAADLIDINEMLIFSGDKPDLRPEEIGILILVEAPAVSGPERRTLLESDIEPDREAAAKQLLRDHPRWKHYPLPQA